MADDNVVELPVITKLDLPAERVLRRAAEAKLETVVICGCTEDGEFYFASNRADGAEALWWLEKARTKLLAIDEDDL